MKAKKNQPDLQRCTECGGAMRHETRSDSIEYKGQTRVVRTTGWWCDACNDAVLDGDALAARERAFLELRAEVDGVLSPREVGEIRQRLGISQRRAGEVLGGGPRSFQKYEKGTAAVSTPMSNLLRLLSNDPGRLQELVPEHTGAAKGRGAEPSRTAAKARSRARRRP